MEERGKEGVKKKKKVLVCTRVKPENHLNFLQEEDPFPEVSNLHLASQRPALSHILIPVGFSFISH